MSDGSNCVRTEEIKAAVAGREGEILDALGISWRQGHPHIRCPFPGHSDSNPSWRWDAAKARALCTCGSADIFRVVSQIEATDFAAAKRRVAEILGRDDLIRAKNDGCSLAPLAEAKRIPVDWLAALGVREIVDRYGKPAVEIPYRAERGGLIATRTRIKLSGKKHTLSAKNSKACLYGLDRLDEAQQAGYVILVEGETDCWTLWLNDFPALGLPGAGVFNDARDAPRFTDIPDIYAVVEPDHAGAALAEKLGRSSLAGRVSLVRLPVKDPSALWLDVGADSEKFHEAFQAALDKALPCPTTPTSADKGNRLNHDAAIKYSEDALALKFTAAHGDRLRFVAQWNRWLLWTGARWKFEQTHLAFDLARRITRELAIAKKDRSLGKANVVAAIERLARADRKHAAEIDQWDVDPWILNQEETTLDLRTGQSRPHRREDYVTKICAAQAAETEDCPLWQQFLTRVTAEDVELQSYLRRVAGYCLTGVTTEHVMFFLYGSGANGKSVFVKTLAAIWADYAANAPMDTFIESKFERHPTELAMLRGARLVVAQETEKGRHWAEAKIKALTGGDPITARFMHQDFFTFVPQFKIIVAGNHKPSLKSVDEANRRRIQMIPFTVKIPPAERDLQLFDKVKPEWPSILRWAVNGSLEWQRVGLAPPPVVCQATDKYLAAQDTLGEWIGECCEIEPIYSVTKKDLFDSWKAWAESRGQHPGSQRALMDAIEARHPELDQSKKQSVTGRALVIGIRVKGNH
jgi:putative DNA primase/helicase